MRLLLKSLGPGVITGAAGDDPSGIATYSVAGAQDACRERRQLDPRLAARRAVKRAVMAVAHTILIIGFHMLKTGHRYHELGGNYLEQINKAQLQRYFVKQLQRLG
jgi:hypothetical protein